MLMTSRVRTPAPPGQSQTWGAGASRRAPRLDLPGPVRHVCRDQGIGDAAGGTPQMTDIRPRRSVLYMPGANERALEKAKTLPADSLILDLEDAVAPEAKAEARDRVCAAVKAGGYGPRELIVRVNGPDTEWGHDDIKAAVAAGPDAILAPKVDSADDIARLNAAIKSAGGDKHPALWVMIETPLAILNLKEIAAEAKRSALAGFVMGTNDLIKDFRAEPVADRSNLATTLTLAIAAARAFDLLIFDGVYNDIQNAEGSRRRPARAAPSASTARP
ncbi:MAG: CoA ester lyase [Hyphomonadaceae bacterium]